MSDDDAERIAHLEREYDLADRRQDHRACGRLAWELGQIAKRDGRVEDFCGYLNRAHSNFALSSARTEELTTLVEILALPSCSISSEQRGQILHSSWAFVSRYQRDRVEIDRAEADLMDWIRRAPEGERLLAEYYSAYFLWFRFDVDAVEVFEGLATQAPISANADDTRLSRESLFVTAMSVAFDLGDLAAGQRIRLRLSSIVSRKDLSPQKQADWRVGERWVRYASTPGATTRRALLHELDNSTESYHKWLSALLRFLSSRAPMRDRIATFRENLRRSKRGRTFYGRWRLRRVVASFAVSCARLACCLPPVSFDPRQPEAFAGPVDDATASDAAAWLAFAHRAVAALTRSSAIMNERLATTNFSTRVAVLREALVELNGQATHREP